MSREEKIYRGLALLRRNQVLTQMLDEAAADYLGINTTDGRALDVIDQAGGRVTAGELARELRLSTGAVTAILDRLEQTPKVQKAASQIYGGPEDALAWADDFSDAELDVLLRFQEQGMAWLEDRLERIEKLKTRAKPR